MGKSVDSQVLAALHLLSKDRRDEGVPYLEFVKQGIMNGVLELIDQGYAVKIHIRDGMTDEDVNYRFTPKGTKLLKKVVKYTSEQF